MFDGRKNKKDRQADLNQHYPVASHDRISSNERDCIAQPIMHRRDIVNHHLGHEVIVECSRVNRAYERIGLLNGVISRPLWVKPIGGQPRRYFGVSPEEEVKINRKSRIRDNFNQWPAAKM